MARRDVRSAEGLDGLLGGLARAVDDLGVAGRGARVDVEPGETEVEHAVVHPRSLVARPASLPACLARDVDADLRYGYFGPRGTFTEMALATVPGVDTAAAEAVSTLLSSRRPAGAFVVPRRHRAEEAEVGVDFGKSTVFDPIGLIRNQRQLQLLPHGAGEEPANGILFQPVALTRAARVAPSRRRSNAITPISLFDSVRLAPLYLESCFAWSSLCACFSWSCSRLWLSF